MWQNLKQSWIKRQQSEKKLKEEERPQWKAIKNETQKTVGKRNKNKKKNHKKCKKIIKRSRLKKPKDPEEKKAIKNS